MHIVDFNRQEKTVSTGAAINAGIFLNVGKASPLGYECAGILAFHLPISRVTKVVQVPPALAREIQELETLLHEPATRSDTSRLDALLAEDFTEFGSSGRIYSKDDILAELPSQLPQQISVSQFRVTGVSPDVCLATYRAEIESDGVVTRSLRSSIWTYRLARWQIVFHQGSHVDPFDD